MRLYFLRHGIAHPGSSTLRDFDRPLTAEGRAELEPIARAMVLLKVRPDPILASPLVRARETAEIVAPVLGGTLRIVDELSSGAGFAAFQNLVKANTGAKALMFVGHEPDLSEAAGELIGTFGSTITLKKAGLIRVDIDGRAEPGRGHLRWLLTPDQLVLIGHTGIEPSDDTP